MKALLAVALVLVAAQEPQSTSVGMAATRDDVVLPGSLLEARPADLKTPLILRVARVDPHGSAFRYRLVWYGLEPGRFDLRDYLQRVDGSATDDLPSLPVEVTSVLRPGEVLPMARPVGAISGLGGYRVLLIGAAVVWGLGLVVLLLRGRKARASHAQRGPVGPTFEERLNALLSEAKSGPLSPRRRAELELALVEHWRRRLDLSGLAPAAAFERLREHPESATCIRQLEEWLHRPGQKGEPPDLTSASWTR